jgi:branched-chain amino acid transport system permease protein
MEYLVAQLINGLAIGSIYALMSVGYSIIYGILQLINFAHGDLCMLGAYVMLTLLLATGNVFLALIGACIFGAFVGLVVERTAYRPVRGGTKSAPFVSAVGASIVLRSIVQLVWGSQTMHFPSIFPTIIYKFAGYRISSLSIYIFVSAVVIMIIVAIVVQKTKVGLAVRCVSQNFTASFLMGIPVNRIVAAVYAIGAAVGVFGQVFYATYYNSVFLSMGFAGTIKAFTASLLGGLGSLYGAFLGGMILGIAEAIGAGFVSSGFRDAIAYGVLILTLVLMPSGLFGARTAEKV